MVGAGMVVSRQDAKIIRKRVKKTCRKSLINMTGPSTYCNERIFLSEQMHGTVHATYITNSLLSMETKSFRTTQHKQRVGGTATHCVVMAT